MTRTIKQLADALGVSKTAIRKYMTEEFRRNHTETDRNGVITISQEGCKLLAESLGRTENLSETSENKIPVTEETTEKSDNLVIPRVVWNALQEELKTKNQQIAALTQLTDQAQRLHAGTIQQALPEEPAAESAPPIEVNPDHPEPDPKPSFWQYLKSYFS